MKNNIIIKIYNKKWKNYINIIINNNMIKIIMKKMMKIIKLLMIKDIMIQMINSKKLLVVHIL
jgi:hypothetical protein